MQFFVYGSPADKQPGPEALAELGKFMEVSITDGPFLEAKELMPGFAVIQVDTKEKAIEWVTNQRRLYGDGETKLVQIFGPS